MAISTRHSRLAANCGLTLDSLDSTRQSPPSDTGVMTDFLPTVARPVPMEGGCGSAISPPTPRAAFS
jgi:hypothetical protein